MGLQRGVLSPSSTSCQAALAVALLIVDLCLVGSLCLVIGLDHPSFFKLGSFRHNQFDILLATVAKVVCLLLLYWEAQQIGTVYRQGRDGDSAPRAVVTRFLIVFLPLAFLVFVAVKVVLVGNKELVGETPVNVALTYSVIGMSVCELVAGMVAFSWIRYEDSDKVFAAQEAGLPPQEARPAVAERRPLLHKEQRM